jgi:ketosteroid isomerase-like protein
MKMQRLTSWLAVVGVISVLPGFAQAAGNASKGDVSSAIEAMENKWEANVGKKEEGAKAVGAMVSDDFVGVSSKGKRMTKASLLAEYRKDGDTYTSTKNANLKVYVMSSSAAVAVGDAVEKGKGKDGKSFDRTFRFTDTWLQRNGKWQCVATQIALVRGSAPKG